MTSVLRDDSVTNDTRKNISEHAVVHWVLLGGVLMWLTEAW